MMIPPLRVYAQKSAESASLWSCGDVLAQYVTERMAPEDSKKGSNWYNPKRTMRSAAFAATFYAPFATTWYANLANKIPGGTPQDIAKKVIADQSVFGPALLTSFFLVMPLFEGKQGSTERLKNEFWGSMKMNWSVWGPVQIVNFALIPPQYWVLVCNCVSIPWTAYLAWRNAKASAAEGGH